MTSGPRPLSNNVAACIGEIIALTLDVRPRLETACQAAEERYQDVALLADLVDIERAVNDIEHHALNAQQNKFEVRRHK